jgi:hypothetical protein
MALGKRAISLTGNIAIFIAGYKNKDTYSKIAIPDLFYKDRKKFKIYYTQIRLYL